MHFFFFLPWSAPKPNTHTDVLPPPCPTQMHSKNLSRPARETLDAVLRENTFHPKITRLAKKKGGEGSVHERLMAYGEAKVREHGEQVS